MRSYRIGLEPEGATYVALLAGSLKLSSIGLLVVRDTSDLSKSGLEILRRLRPFIVRESRESEWPGTALLDGQTATIYRFSIVRDSVDILTRSAGRLYDWQQPERPEDLAFIRGNGIPWLLSIAHESEAYIVATDEELRVLRQEVPDLGPLIPERIGEVTEDGLWRQEILRRLPPER